MKKEKINPNIARVAPTGNSRAKGKSLKPISAEQITNAIESKVPISELHTVTITTERYLYSYLWRNNQKLKPGEKIKTIAIRIRRYSDKPIILANGSLNTSAISKNAVDGIKDSDRIEDSYWSRLSANFIIAILNEPDDSERLTTAPSMTCHALYVVT